MARRGRARQHRRAARVAAVGVATTMAAAAVVVTLGRGQDGQTVESVEGPVQRALSPVGLPASCADLEARLSRPPITRSAPETIPPARSGSGSGSGPGGTVPAPIRVGIGNRSVRTEDVEVPGGGGAHARRVVDGPESAKPTLFEVPANEPGSLADPQVVGDWLYFLWWEALGQSPVSIRRVRLSGGAPEDVVMAPEGGGFAVSPDGTKLARVIGGMGIIGDPPTAIVISDTTSHREIRRIPGVRSDGWTIREDLVWDPDSTHLFPTIGGPFSATDCRTGAHLTRYPGLEDPGAGSHVAVEDTGLHPVRIDTATGTLENAPNIAAQGLAIAVIDHAGGKALVVDPLFATSHSSTIPSFDSPELDAALVDVNSGELLPFVARRILVGDPDEIQFFAIGLGWSILPR
jgi:hypothetical protein